MDRRVAILYWNYPPGKQNVGASYLNVVRSVPVMLRQLRNNGYDIGDIDLEKSSRNRKNNSSTWT